LSIFIDEIFAKGFENSLPSLLQYAATKEKTAAVEMLLQAGTRDNESIYSAIYAGNMEMVQMLLEAGTDLTITDRLGRTPLEYAKNMRGRKRIVNLMEKAMNQ
jgi:ankyrin repeat protein